MKRVITLTLALCLVIALCSGAYAAGSDAVTFSVATSYAEGSDYINAMQAACDAITEKTNGEVEFVIYCSNQLGSTNDCTEMMLNGANIMAGIGMANLAGYVKEAAIPSYPFVVKNYDDLKNLTTSEWWEGVKQQLIDQWNMVPVMYLSIGYRNMIGTAPIYKAEDFSSIITRIGLGSIGQEFIEACGGTPTTTSAFSDCYSAIQTGMFELCEADVELLYNSALYEVSSYLSMTHHMTCPSVFAVNKNAWDKLSESAQAIMVEELEKAAETIWNNYSVKEDVWVEKFEEAGVTVIKTDEIDVDSFIPTVSYIMEKQGVDSSEYEAVLAAVAGN